MTVHFGTQAWKNLCMTIEVKFAGSPVEYREGQGDWFEFLPQGVLALHFGDSGKATEYYSPGVWEWVCSKQPPGPIAPTSELC